MKKVTFDETDIKKIIHLDTPARRFWRRTAWVLRQALYLAVVFVVFFYALNFAAYLQRFHYSIAAKPVSKVAITPPPPAAPLPDYPPAVEIPKIAINAPLTVNVANGDMIANLKNGVVQYLNSALPGEVGNMVLVGHSSDYPWSDGKYKTVFALIDKLQAGDQIIIPYHSQKYVYEVTGSKIVKPTDLSVLQKTNTPTLTLLTCYPVGTTRSRYIVLAKLISDNAGQAQTTDPLLETIVTPR